ncbi:ribokinase [Luteimonas sp. 8-5]|uniref:ribokinase n=1 Tax=Luteimonas sp. 8-5 TaxID=3039387 RepID=UPI002436D608|nr:ribokinase [Luteimonas sp. 8-5]MDG6347900.1 ribokinase [Luteimonas sp. 8-5]
MAGKVVVVGSFNVDHVWRCAELPAPGATLAGDYLSGPGGKGFNQAVAAARAGAATSFVCALGDDAGGALARSLAAGDAIDLHAMPSDAPTGTAGIFVDAAGRNSIVIGAGANARLDPASVESRAPLFRDAAVVLAQLETPYDTVVAALRAGRACGATTLLNPAPAPALDAAARDALLGLADVLTPNETEFAGLANASGAAIGAEAVAGMDDAALHALCRGLLPGGTVVVTLGAAGAFVSHRDEDRHGDTRNCYRLPAERVAAIDTTGAGDAFNGALAAAIAGSGAAFADMARFAGRYAALSTERHGAAASMPSREQVEARFTPD